jgi:hypothetical protein
MKFKYILALLVAVCATSSVSKAQTVVFEGGGSSALFVEVGEAAAAYENSVTAGSACIWTSNTVASANVAAVDNRPSVYALAADTQLGKIWVVYGKGAGTCAAPVAPFNVYSYMSLDSVLGDRCFFEVDTSDNNPGCIQTMTPSVAEAASQNTNYLKLGACPGDTYCDSAVALPASVSGALNGKHWNVAGTDVLPVDAKFASYRMFTPCGQAVYRQPFDQGLRITYGLGYQTTNAGVGTTLREDIGGTAAFTVLDFNIAGNDPINAGHAVPAYMTTTIGAQPIIVTVSPAGAGTVWANATDINTFTLTLFYQGVLGRTQDIPGGASGASLQPVTTLVREPLSGTYNTFEYSVPNSSEFHGSQDDNNCSGTSVFSNPMRLASANGTFIGPNGDGSLSNGYAYRRRTIGTGHMVAQLQAASTTDARLGYWFWSAGNAGAFSATNGKYLTVNGVDPLQNSYSNGVIPTGASLSNVTFKGMQAGDYPIWSALRLVTSTVAPAGLGNVVSGLGTINPTQHDYVAPSNLTVWHSHFYLQAIGNTAGANGTVALNVPSVGTTNICPVAGALAELGGDAGGANVFTQANYDFCSDFSNITGLINKAN